MCCDTVKEPWVWPRFTRYASRTTTLEALKGGVRGFDRLLNILHAVGS